MTRRTLPLALALAALAACGGGANQSAGGEVDSSRLGPSVSDKDGPAADSGYVAAQKQLDSLGNAGVTPAQGIDSAASRAGTTLTNDPTADTMVYRKMRVPPKANP
jgi:hypothetical protein